MLGCVSSSVHAIRQHRLIHTSGINYIGGGGGIIGRTAPGQRRLPKPVSGTT
jgi:hypothetical protein